MRIIIKTSYYVLNLLLISLLIPVFIFPRFIKKKIDVGIGPLPLINNIYWAKALKLKNYRVETFVNDCYYITRDFDVKFKELYLGLFYYFPAFAFLRNCFRYRIIYQYFNGGVLGDLGFPFSYIEPFLLKLSGVKIVVMPYGSDSQSFLLTHNKLMVNALSKDYSTFFKFNQSKVSSQVARWTLNADFVIAAMDFVDYISYWDLLVPCHFGVEKSKNFSKSKRNPLATASRIKILHAFNHKEVKGTKYIDDAIEKLINYGYEIDYIKLTRVSNDEVRDAIESVDIVIDQLIMGFYGMFALEAMSMGKAVFCYIREDLMELYSQLGFFSEEDFPIINANVTNIYDKLKEFIDKPNQFDEYRTKSLMFIEKNNSLEAIGTMFDNINRSVLKLNEN